VSLYLDKSFNLYDKYEDVVKMEALGCCPEAVLDVDVLQMMHSSIFLSQPSQFPINKMGILKFSVSLWFLPFGAFTTLVHLCAATNLEHLEYSGYTDSVMDLNVPQQSKFLEKNPSLNKVGLKTKTAV